MARDAKIPEKFFQGATPIAVVAGGAGFVGSHLCEALLRKQLKVICVDNLATGAKENVSHLGQNSDFVLLEHDVSKPLPRFIERADYVVHLAGIEAYLNGEDVSIETLEANSLGTKNLLEFAGEKKSRFLLGSTTHVYFAQIGDKQLKNYFGPGRVFEGEFSHHEAKRFAEALTSEYANKENVDARIVRVADVYGPRMMLSSARPAANLIKQALYGGPLRVPSQEELSFYPVYIDDVVGGVSKALFSSGTKNKIISLTGAAVSAFSFAQAIKTVVDSNEKLSLLKGQNLELGFVDEEFPREELPEQVNVSSEPISWRAETTVEEGILNTLVWFLQNMSRVPEREAKKREDKKSFWQDIKHSEAFSIKAPGLSFKTSKLLPVGIAVGLFFWVFLLPFIEFGAAFLQLSLFKRSILAGNVQKAQMWAGGASYWAALSWSSFSRWQALPGFKTQAVVFSERSKALEKAAQAGVSASKAAEGLQSLAQGILGDDPFNPEVPANNLALELTSLAEQLAFLEAQLEGMEALPEITGSMDIAYLRNAISGVIPIFQNAGTLLGSDSKKTYLVLLQNNMELRPTGGFIGSFALISFDKGRLVNMEVQDVYSADGQLKGYVEPPGPIREHLGEAGWYLRDSNWSPDFATSAARASWFIEKELGQEVYAVVGLDLELARQLVRIFGPLKLADFDTELTADNLYEKTQFAAEGEFFPGSRAKKDFLTALTRALLSKILGPESGSLKQSLLPSAKAVLSSLETRHMAVWVNDPEIMQHLRHSGWAGTLRNVSCPGQACIADYLMVVEANLGVNKANYFLDRSYSLSVTVGEDSITHELALSYKNNSESGVWPGGDYKNYVRVLVPQGAEFTSARLIDPESGKEEKLSADEESEKGKRSFGFLAVVPAGKARQLVTSWKLAAGKEREELVLLWQKQLGTSQDPLFANIELPEGSQVGSAYPAPSLTASSTVGYNTNLATDLLFNIKWQGNNPINK